jgi:hypothetical protein
MESQNLNAAFVASLRLKLYPELTQRMVSDKKAVREKP